MTTTGRTTIDFAAPRLALAGFAVAAATWAAAAEPGTIGDQLAAIRGVGPEGAGNTAAATAWKAVVQGDAARIPAVLAAMDGANPLAANWLSAAVDALATGHGPVPLDGLRAFLSDTRHDAHARRLAYELIRDRDPDGARGLIAGMLDDPAGELRRDAVQLEIEAAAVARGEGRKEEAIAGFGRALAAARDVDQITAIDEALKGLGQAVDLPRQFGFLMHWQVIGPFDNKEGCGFATVFPPEEKVDLAASVAGRDGPVSWKPLATTDAYGMVDLNPAYPAEGGLKEVLAYAYAEYEAAEARDAELRLGCKNAWKIWHNGRLVFGRDEYHRGMKIDQYRLPIRLERGRNTILVKLCQDEQKQEWTKEWQFQLRVCDATGTALLAVDRPPTAAAPTAEKKP